MLSGRSAVVRNATGGFLLACTLTLTGPTVVHAAPDTAPNAGAQQPEPEPGPIGHIGELINQVADADQRLARIDDEVADSREQANKALVDLDSARAAAQQADAKVGQAKQAMLAAGADIARAQQCFDRYAAQEYTRSSSATSIAALTGAHNPGDLLERSQLMDTVWKSRQATLDGLQRAQLQRANQYSAARATQAEAAAAVATAARRRAEAQQAIAAAEAIAAQQDIQRTQIQAQRDTAQNRLDTARSEVSGLPERGAAFVAWDRNQMLQRLQSAAVAAARAAAGVAVQRLSAKLHSRAATTPDKSPQSYDSGTTATENDDSSSDSADSDSSAYSSDSTGTVKATGNRAKDIETVISRGMSKLGVVYAWGGGNNSGPTKGIRDHGVADRHGDYRKIGFDCSGLVKYAFAGVGFSLPHYSGYQYNMQTRVPVAQRQRGDLLFWGKNGSRHVALYLGNGKMLEAPQSGSVVKISPVRLNGIMPYAVRLIT